jgi:hypothetical protein
MQFQSPYKSGRTAMMLTGVSPQDVLLGSQLLLLGEVQGQTSGDMVLLEPGQPEPKVTSVLSGTSYATGKAGSYSPVESFLFTKPVAYYSVIGGVLVILSVALFLILRRLRARNKRGGK